MLRSIQVILPERKENMAKSKFPKDTCTACGGDAYAIRQRRPLCAMHFRIDKMRDSARQSGKVVPSRSEIEAIFPRDWNCTHCGCPMTAKRAENPPAVASLQHYRDGSLGVVCLSCNSRHGSMDGDEFRNLPEGHKQCCRCKVIKPISDFWQKRKHKTRRYYPTICAPCGRALSKAGHRKRKNL
jgi:hypothetical protein